MTYNRARYDACQIVNWFIERAQKDEGKTLTIMTLLKLIYFAQGWHLALRKQPLYDNQIQAWQYGPVVPDVYYKYRPYGTGYKNIYIDKILDVPVRNQFTEADVDFLDGIYKHYASVDAMKLSEITHEPEGPWDVTRKYFGLLHTISNELIENYYKKIISRIEQTTREANVK